MREFSERRRHISRASIPYFEVRQLHCGAQLPRRLFTMKREVQREVRLPAFALFQGELEHLWQRMRELFEGETGIRTSINLSLPNEKLQFESVADLKAYVGLKGRVTDFSLEILQGDRSVKVKSGGLFSSVPTVTVKAESDAWCAAAIHVVMSVIKANRVWYSWIVRLPLGIIYFLLCLTIVALAWLSPKALTASTVSTLSLFFALLVFGFLTFFKATLLPSASLIFTRELGFIRQYVGEISLVLSIVALVLALYTWRYPVAP